MAVLVALQHGVSMARSRNQRVRHLVLTDGTGDLDFRAFYAAFTKRLVPRLRRGGYVSEYAVALEVQPTSGRLHGHVLLIEPEGRNGYIPKGTLNEITGACGFGWAFISEVRDIPPARASLLEYFVKGAGGNHSVPSRAVGEIGTYMAKAHEMAQLAGFADTRLRPFRVSRGWALSLTDAATRLRAEMFGEQSDPGPWVRAQERKLERWLRPLRDEQRRQRERTKRWEQVLALEELRRATACA